VPELQAALSTALVPRYRLDRQPGEDGVATDYLSEEL